MSFRDEVKYVRRLYSHKKLGDELLVMQRNTTNLFFGLTQYRIDTNFNGYESQWKESDLYRSFITALESSFIPYTPEYTDHFANYLQNTLSGKPRWFLTMEENYNQNLSRFAELAGQAPFVEVSNILPYFEGIPIDNDRSEQTLTRAATTEVVLRLAYHARGQDRMRFNLWLKKSFVMLFSSIFGKR